MVDGANLEIILFEVVKDEWKYDTPRPSCMCNSAFANSDCPVRNMHPHPASLVQPFSPPQFHLFATGELAKPELPAFIAPCPVEGSLASASRAASVVSRMG